MLQRTVSTSLDLAITPFACAHMDTASAPVDNRIFKVHWANDMASTLKKSLLWVGVIAGLNAAEICGARAACDDPRYVALRQSLVAQLNSIGARIEAGNCGLIPSWLSFARSGNARLARSPAVLDGTCSTSSVPSDAESVVTLQRLCHSGGSVQAKSNDQPVAAGLPKQRTKQAQGTPSEKPKVATSAAGQAKGSDPKGLPSKTQVTAAATPAAGQPSVGCGNRSSDITGTGSGSNGAAPASSAPCKPVPVTAEPQPAKPTQTQQTATAAPIPDGSAALDSLLAQVPALTAILDHVDNSMDHPSAPSSSDLNAPKPDLPKKEPALEAAPSRDGETAMAVPDTAPSARPPDSASSTPGDYAEECRQMAKENGFQSLKDDFAEALKNPKGQFGFKFFRKKYQQVRNTLRKCISDPLKLAFLDVLDRSAFMQVPDEPDTDQPAQILIKPD